MQISSYFKQNTFHLHCEDKSLNDVYENDRCFVRLIRHAGNRDSSVSVVTKMRTATIGV